MDDGNASEPSALGSQDSVTAFEDNDMCEGDESLGSWTADDDPPSKKSATRPSGMASLARELGAWPFAVAATLKRRRARAKEPGCEQWWTRQHNERRRPRGAAWAARHRGVDALAAAVTDALRALGPLALTRVSGRWAVADEGVALGLLLSEGGHDSVSTRRHPGFDKATNAATAQALDGLCESCGGPTALLTMTTAEGRTLAAQCVVSALRPDVPLSTAARVAWFRAALPLCLRSLDEDAWPLTCAARHAVGRLVSDASCACPQSPLPRWWDADDSTVRGSKNRADRFSLYWYALRSDVLRAHRTCRRTRNDRDAPGFMELEEALVIERALDGIIEVDVKTVSSDGGLGRALATETGLLNALGSLACIVGGTDGRSRQADQFLAPPVSLTKMTEAWNTGEPYLRAALAFGDLPSDLWTASDAISEPTLGFGPGARLLNALVAKDAVAASEALGDVIRRAALSGQGLATTAAFVAATLEGGAKERRLRRCPAALALALSTKDDMPDPTTWSVSKVAAWCACVVEGSSVGGRCALARATETSIRDHFGILSDGLMNDRGRLLAAVPRRAVRAVEQELRQLDAPVPKLADARRTLQAALLQGPLAVLVDACVAKVPPLEDSEAWAGTFTMTPGAAEAWRSLGEASVAAAMTLKDASVEDRRTFAQPARKIMDAYLTAADACRARCDRERETSLTTSDAETRLLGVAAQTASLVEGAAPALHRLASTLPSFSVFLLAVAILQGPPLSDDDDVDDGKAARDVAACVCALCLESCDSAVGRWLRDLAGTDDDLLSGNQCGASQAARVAGDHAPTPLSHAPTKMMRAALGLTAAKWPFATDSAFAGPLRALHEACLRDEALEKWLGDSVPCLSAVRLRGDQVHKRPWLSDQLWCSEPKAHAAEHYGTQAGAAVAMLVAEAETLRREVGDAYAMPLDGAALGLALCPGVMRPGDDFNGPAFRAKAYEGALPALAKLLNPSDLPARTLRKDALKGPEERIRALAELRRRAAWTCLLVSQRDAARCLQHADVAQWLGLCLADGLRGIRGGTRRIVAPDAAGARLVDALSEAGAAIPSDVLARACQHGRTRTALALVEAGASLESAPGKSLVGAARRVKAHALADELVRRGAALGPPDDQAWPGPGDDAAPWSWLPDTESDMRWLCANHVKTTPAVLNHLLAYGCLDAARLLIVEGRVDVNQRDASGLAPLHVACGLRATRWGFLAPDAGDGDAWGADREFLAAATSQRFHETPAAPRCGTLGPSFALVPPREAATKLLLEAGADPDVLSAIGSPLSIALRAAAAARADALGCARDAAPWYDPGLAMNAAKGWAGASYGAPDRVVDAIAATRHPGAPTAKAMAAAASRRGHDAAVRACEALELASAVAGHGLDPMSRAALAEISALKCVRALLANKGADVDVACEDPWPTALCAAAGSGQAGAVQALVENGAKTEGALVAACGGFVTDARDTIIASASMRAAGKASSARCVEILLRACRDEGLEAPRTAALIGAVAHGALDAARVLCKGLGDGATVVTPAIARRDLKVRRNPTWVTSWGDHPRQHPRLGREGLLKAWTDRDGNCQGSYPQIRRPELNAPGLCIVRWADPVSEQVCRVGFEDEFWLVAADEAPVTTPPAVAAGVVSSLAGACRANDAHSVSLAVDLLAFTTPDRGAALLKRRADRGAVACAQLCCCGDDRDALRAVARLPADAWTTSGVATAPPVAPVDDALDLLSPDNGTPRGFEQPRDAPATRVSPRAYREALAVCLGGRAVACAEELLTLLGCLPGDAYATDRPDAWGRTAREVLVDLARAPFQELGQRVRAALEASGEVFEVEDDAGVLEASALGAARYIRDAPTIIRRLRIQETDLLARLVRKCAAPERLEALLDLAVASGASVRAVANGVLRLATERGAVACLRVVAKRLLREDAAEAARQTAGCLRLAIERSGGDDANAAACVAVLIGLGADPDDASLRTSLDVDQRVEARFEGGEDWYAGRIVAANGDGTYAILYEDGDREEQVDAALIKSRQSSARPSLLYEALRRFAPHTARELLLAGCADAPFAGRTAKAWALAAPATTRVWAKAVTRLCLDAPTRGVSTFRPLLEVPILDKENVPLKRKKKAKRPASPALNRRPFVARRSRGNPRPFGEAPSPMPAKPARGLNEKGMMECVSILQDALMIGAPPASPPRTLDDDDEEAAAAVAVPRDEPTLHGAELDVRLLNLDPDAMTTAPSDATQHLFDDARGIHKTLSVDDAADALRGSSLLDEALHGPRRLWGGDEAVSLALVRRLLRREAASENVTLSAFARTHQKLAGAAFPRADESGPSLVLNVEVYEHGAWRQVQEVGAGALDRGRAFVSDELVLAAGLRGRARFAITPNMDADLGRAVSRPFLISAEPPPARLLKLEGPSDVDAGDMFMVTCVATDARGRAARGGRGSLRCEGPGTKEVDVVFDGRGRAELKLNLAKAGTYVVNASVGETTSAPHALLVRPGFVSSLRVSFATAACVDDEFGFLEETTTAAVAGDTLPPVRVEARDSAGNGVTYAGSGRLVLKRMSQGKWLGPAGENEDRVLAFADGVITVEDLRMTRAGTYRWEGHVKDVTHLSDVFEVKAGPCASYRPVAPKLIEAAAPWSLKVVPCDTYGNVLDHSESAKVGVAIVATETAPPLTRTGFRVVDRRKDGQLKLRKLGDEAADEVEIFEVVKRGVKKAATLDGPVLGRAGVYEIVVKTRLSEQQRLLLVAPGAPARIALSVDVDEDSPIRGDDLLRCRAVVLDARGNVCTAVKYRTSVRFRLASLKPLPGSGHVAAQLQTTWDEELDVDHGTVDYEARPVLSGVFCVVATGSYAHQGTQRVELESGVSTSFCVLSGPPRSLKFEPFHSSGSASVLELKRGAWRGDFIDAPPPAVVNNKANVSLTLVDGNDERARVDGSYEVRLLLIRPDRSEIDCGTRPVFRGAVEFYGVNVPEDAGAYIFEALLTTKGAEVSRREAPFRVEAKVQTVDESVQRRLAVRARKKACEHQLRKVRAAAGWTGGLDAKALRRPRFKVDAAKDLPAGEEALARGRPSQDWKVEKWLACLAKYEVALEARILQLVKDERAERLAPPVPDLARVPSEASPSRTRRRKASKGTTQACESIANKQLVTLRTGGAACDADEGVRLAARVGPALNALAAARRDRDQVHRLKAYDRGEARRLAERALNATGARLEAVLNAHRARKRSWRLLAVGDYDVDAEEVERLPRPAAAVKAITERISSDLVNSANLACQRQRKRHAYTRLGDVYCRVVAGGIEANDAAVVALLRGAAASAYGARASKRREPGVVLLRVERQGALVEIEVSLRDVRRLAHDAAAYRALIETVDAETVDTEGPAPAQALFSPVLAPPPAAPEAPVPANAPAPAPAEDEPQDVIEAVAVLIEKGKRSRRVLGPDHPLTVEVLGQLEQALSPTSPFSPAAEAPAPAAGLVISDV